MIKPSEPSVPRFIRIEFERGVSPEEYDKFVAAVLDLAEKANGGIPPDCDNEIWVSGRGGKHIEKLEEDAP